MTDSLLGLVLALGFASLVEYGLHYALHHRYFRRTWLGRMHLRHHVEGKAQPLLRELTDYLPLAVLFSPLGLLGSWAFFGGWVVGAFGYAALAGAAHNYAHARGSAFHETHHHFPFCNYGVVTPVWDWFFRTLYKPSSFVRSEPDPLVRTEGPSGESRSS